MKQGGGKKGGRRRIKRGRQIFGDDTKKKGEGDGEKNTNSRQRDIYLRINEHLQITTEDERKPTQKRQSAEKQMKNVELGDYKKKKMKKKNKTSKIN